MTITLLDETTRPKAPRIAGATPAHRERGSRLGLFHAMHLQEIAKVEAMIRQIQAGQAEAAALGEAISGLQMAANYRLFGNLCGQECQFLTFHHRGEDSSIFPALMQGSDGLRRVVERLMEEHAVIHGLIEKMATEAEAIVRAPDAASFAALKSTFGTLVAMVRSHFGYEQTELEEALGYYDLMP